MNFRQVKLAVLAAAIGTSGYLQAANSPATIPAAFEGTYNLTYTEINPSPWSNGQALTLVVKPGGILCIESLNLSLGNPFLVNGNPAEANWVTVDGLLFGLSNLTGAFNEVNVGQADSNGNPTGFYGQLNGSRVSSSTTCNANGNVSVTADMQTIVNLAKELYPDLFGNESPFRYVQGYTYKYFANSGIYAGFKDGFLYLLGGPFGGIVNGNPNVNAVVNKGLITQVKAKLQEQKIKLIDDGIDVGDTDFSGNYKLVVSGTVSTLGISVSFPGITIDNILAPGSADIDDLEDAVRETITEVGTLNNLTVTKGEISSSRIQFQVSFSATIQGITSSYNLNYDYTKK